MHAQSKIHVLQDPPYDSGSYAKIVTRDASEEGGSAPACASNVRKVRRYLQVSLPPLAVLPLC